MGCLKRIAALTALATTAVMVAGVVNVPAALTLPSTDPVTTTLDTTTQVTVPSTTTTVPSTPVSPTTTVTTPTVTTPKSPTKTITNTGSRTLDQTTSTVKKTTGTVTQSPTSGSGGGGGGSGGGAGSTLTKQTSSTIDAVTGVASGGTSSGTSSAKGTLGTAGGGSLTGTAGGGGTAGSSTGLGAFGFFGDSGGPGGPAGGTGTNIFGGPAGGGGAGGGGGLPATLSAAGAKQLRFALEQLDGCMSAIAPIDRQVLGMRAGRGGAPPLSRRQVASRLGVSTRQVRLSERRGLSGLRVAAEQTGCAGALGGPFAVSGIGDLTPTVFAAAPGAGFAAQGGAAGGDYVPARAAEAESGSPLKDLQRNGTSGPAWLVVLVTILFSVSIAALTRELRSSVGA
jgi:hypothetical protein